MCFLTATGRLRTLWNEKVKYVLLTVLMNKMSHRLVVKLKAVADADAAVVITSLTKVFFPFYFQLGYVFQCMLITFDNHCMDLEAFLLFQEVRPFAGVVYGYVQ